MNSMKMTILTFIILALTGCTPAEPDNGGTGSVPSHNDPYYPIPESEYLPAMQPSGDMIMDFSRVGYRWGDEDIPDVPVKLVLSPPEDGGDATALIQNAVDLVSDGAVLLSKGIYNVYGTIRIGKSGVVLRGEGQDETGGTVIRAAGTGQRDLIVIEGSGKRHVDRLSSESNVIDDYVPSGRFWLRTSTARSFSIGDEVVIYRPSTREWISDLRMDQIPPRSDGGKITQWQPGKYDLYAERIITKINGDTLHFENPVPMSLDRKYGGGSVFPYHYDGRIEGVGVENLLLVSDYASDEDENHGWNAVTIAVAEHCWVRNVTSKFFGMGLVSIDDYAKNISVLNCTCLAPKSQIAGSRRYSFHISQGQLCLVKGCKSDDARHDYATGAMNCGPNVFTDCTATNTHADIGPHQRWNVGTLYDNITTDGEICIQDRSNYGSGHGWAGANNVVWNCTASVIIVQSPWVSAYNWCIGSTGRKSPGKFTNPLRPDGVWMSAGEKASPAYLYEAQLLVRKRSSEPGGATLRR